MILQEARQYLIAQLSPVYDDREAVNITDWVLEHLTGLKKIDRLLHKQTPLTAAQSTLLEKYTARLLDHTPVQYVLHEAWFAGMAFYVDENVLIPRPETEELVEWIITEAGSRKSEIRNSTFEILDIGTGSGCIPIALKKQLPAATVYACDVSEGALKVAQRNAEALNAAVQFLLLDFLEPANWSSLPPVNILVSNPPYIPVKDKNTMRENVLQHEPHLALFVEDDDPLLFYRKIAAFARQQLLPGGKVYVEIHEDLGRATMQLFEDNGFTGVELKQDMQGKDRMIRAMKIA